VAPACHSWRQAATASAQAPRCGPRAP